ncbi:FAD:protein FMN transferase [Deinococcus sp. HMF7620]|uniref:FAD:protein FMN transferase n=1 Tax=Deinococcus arboris TaxID=2682977 RepID=A0A7C9HXL1_9DEIO|nr:FAD:protein FMN transferase [Deinococcus arboris]MVN85455.1 FAD:protein FMN transferase [Deinococcus arboris]
MARVTLASLLGAARPTHRLHRTYQRLLGAEVAVQIVAGTREQAEQAEQDALNEIERLSAVLNRFDPSSELRRWLSCPGAERVPLSLDLTAVLRLTDHWRLQSGGALHPGADAYGPLWAQAVRTGQLPAPGQLQRLASALQAAPWTLHADGTATLHTQEPLGLDALAKGYIVDRAAAVASRGSGVRSVMVNAGGDLRVVGKAALKVLVPDPFTARDGAPPAAQVRLKDCALATSGSAQRGYQVGEQWYSHLFDPRTGWPVQAVPGVTVTAPDCATADALATAVSVMGVQTGLACVDAQPGCAALLVTADGQRHPSRAWRGRLLARR